MCDIDPQWSVAYNTSAVFMSLNQMLPKFPYLRSCHGVCTSKSHIRNDLAGVTCSFKEKTTRWMFQEPEYPEIFQSDKILIIYRSVVSTLDHYSSSILKPFNSQASNVRPRGDDSPNSHQSRPDVCGQLVIIYPDQFIFSNSNIRHMTWICRFWASQK